MSIDTTSKAARRQIADEFKQCKVPRGIFAVRCSATGEVWVGSSPNLASARNSLWFQLGTGQYRNQPLQQAWQQHGEGAFTLDVLELLTFSEASQKLSSYVYCTLPLMAPLYETPVKSGPSYESVIETLSERLHDVSLPALS